MVCKKSSKTTDFKGTIIMPKSGKKPERLVVYFHGMGGTGESNAWFGEALSEVMKDAIIYIPDGFFPIDGNEETREWFDVPPAFNDDWFTVYPTELKPEDHEKFMKMYEYYDIGALRAVELVNQLKKKHKITASNTYLYGVSQGAMMLLQLVAETDLLADKKADGSYEDLGGAMIICGCLLNAQAVDAHPSHHVKEIRMVHGSSDTTVPFKAFVLSDQVLCRTGHTTTCKVVWGKDHTYFEKEAINDILRLSKW
ncbi:MAG: alpha/beta hydrolase [Alphaproteobacteria bacterium]|nr:alpha/beta hydrolase [Alphaproteobacteria bacterium]